MTTPRTRAVSGSIELAAEEVLSLPLGEGWGEDVPASAADTFILPARDGRNALTLSLSQKERGLDERRLNVPAQRSRVGGSR
jgi:hypothetical protein